MVQYNHLWLTCADKAEADNIAKVLLEKQLVACAKQLPVSSDFLWKDEVDHNDEILLVMDSREDLFGQIEQEVAKLHSYDTFVLQAVPVTKISVGAENWLEEVLLTPKKPNQAASTSL